DKRLLRIHSDGPPLPSRPLHFENGPRVSWLIPLLLFARPRRIFLFGADGGSNPSFSKRPYFYYDDYDADVAPRDFLNRPGMISFQGLPRKGACNVSGWSCALAPRAAGKARLELRPACADLPQQTLRRRLAATDREILECALTRTVDSRSARIVARGRSR